VFEAKRCRPDRFLPTLARSGIFPVSAVPDYEGRMTGVERSNPPGRRIRGGWVHSTLATPRSSLPSLSLLSLALPALPSQPVLAKQSKSMYSHVFQGLVLRRLLPLPTVLSDYSSGTKSTSLLGRNCGSGTVPELSATGRGSAGDPAVCATHRNSLALAATHPLDVVRGTFINLGCPRIVSVLSFDGGPPRAATLGVVSGCL